MQIIPLTTRRMRPPQDDLMAVLDAALTEFADGDILVVTSKVVSLHQGRCVPMDGTDKRALIAEEADSVIVPSHAAGHDFRLTITHNALLPSAGIDESNSDGYYTLLPRDPAAAARRIRRYVCTRFGVTRCGVIIADSHSLPLRYGVVGVALGWWGLEPLRSYAGTPDLFGRRIRYAQSNIVDAVAAAAVLVMGEGAEAQPLARVRGVRGVRYTDRDTMAMLRIPSHHDLYAPLLQPFHNTPTR